MPLTKLNGFTFNHSDQPNDISNVDASTVKANFDSRAEEVRVSLNTNIDAINAEFATKTELQTNAQSLTTHKTSSDHDGRYYPKTEVDTKLGLKADKSTTYTKTESDGRFTNKTGDHQGTWQGLTPTQVDQTINSRLIVLEDKYNSPDFSDTLIQNTSTFTTGTGKNASGTDIDVSASVVEGQISDIGVKGRTLNNGLGSNGDFETLTATNYTGTSLALDSTKKAVNNNSVKATLVSTGGYAGITNTNLISSNKYLLFSGYIANNNCTSVKLRFMPVGKTTIETSIETSTSFIRKGIKIKPSDYSLSTELRFSAVGEGVSGQTFNFDGFMVCEITEDEYNNLTVDQLMQKYPFITGTKSTVNSKVVSRRKNNFDGILELGALDTSTGVNKDTTNTIRSKNFIRVKQTTVAISNFSEGATTWVLMYDKNKNYTGTYLSASPTVTIPSNVSYIKFYRTGTINLEQKPQVEYNTPTTYEPYEDSPSEINWSDGEGRSLPNGTYDEIKDGKEYKRTKKLTNVASVTVINYADMKTGGQFVAYYSDGSQQVGVKGDALTSIATVLIYQLANEVVTDAIGLVPITAFPNGDIYIEPQTAGVETTVPTFEYKVPKNQAAQIDGNTAGIRINSNQIIDIYAVLKANSLI